MLNYAHSSQNPQKTWQTLSNHLAQTAKMAGDFADEFNARNFGYICGLLHDLGKYSPKFQEKLLGKIQRVDHSSAGGQEAIRLYGESIGKLLAYCITGHHSGLPNHGTVASTEGTLLSRINKNLHKEVGGYENYLTDQELKIPGDLNLQVPFRQVNEHMGFILSFFIRMLYSCLVDADFLDTERYMSEVIKLRGNFLSLESLNSTLEAFLKGITSTNTKVNILRSNILEQCLLVANQSPGLFSLTVPTGGGKTYSSLAFALKHAVKNNLTRIIYVIPYTSIIEQNAKVFKDVLGKENVLEHHSNYQFQDKQSEDMQSINERLKLATENWDIPIVVTTNVQFFESLFSNRSSRCRKIHNMARSIIIFDEAQMLPLPYLRPCLLAIAELVKNYGSTAVLCTATQPYVNELMPNDAMPIEIMEDPKKLYFDFQKVNVSKKGKIDDNNLAAELNRLDQVLCIVNTRRHAKEIYTKLQGKESSFHLSTLMCPVHRQETLSEIRERLKNRFPCRVISTQLIEAGVDVDFPVVYRSIAGIDSIVQSAGRCNREGNLPTGYVYVFNPNSDYAKIRGYLERTAKVAEEVFRHYKDPISLEAIEFYFKQLYSLEGNEALDKKGILKCFEESYKQLEFDFQKAAEQFRLIEDNTVSIVIPYNCDAKELINEAKYSKYPLSVARKLQPFTLSVYEYEYKKLLNNAALETVNDSFLVLKNLDKFYDEKTGLVLPTDTYGEGIFI